tara:strand:+ start:305 stop:559 length:255 start_codon:yes stop_codon:yes gene_type:complete
MSDVFESTVSETEYENKISDLGFELHTLKVQLEKAENLLKKIKSIGSMTMTTSLINDFLDGEKYFTELRQAIKKIDKKGKEIAK